MCAAMSRWWGLVFIAYETLTDLFMEAGLTGISLLDLKWVGDKLHLPSTTNRCRPDCALQADEGCR